MVFFMILSFFVIRACKKRNQRQKEFFDKYQILGLTGEKENTSNLLYPLTQEITYRHPIYAHPAYGSH